MKRLTFILLLCASATYGQKVKVGAETKYSPVDKTNFEYAVETDANRKIKYDTLVVSASSLKTLSDFEKQIKELQDKQTLYLRGLFEGNNFDVEKIKDLKFENGRFIFRTEK